MNTYDTFCRRHVSHGAPFMFHNFSIFSFDMQDTLAASRGCSTTHSFECCRNSWDVVHTYLVTSICALYYVENNISRPETHTFLRRGGS